MKHHHKEEKENYKNIYYLVGILSGLFTGLVINVSPVWVLVCGVFGLLFTACFIQVLAKSSEEA